MNPENLRLIVLIKDTCPKDLVPLITAHVPMLTFRKFYWSPLMDRWFWSPLQKTVVCKVTEQQFEKAKTYGAHFALTEAHRPELGELGLGFEVREEYHKFFKYLTLWKFEDEK